MSLAASSALWAILLVHSLFVVRNNACSRFMYIIVFSMLRCPSMVLTCIMSLVLWYSIVAFQCLNVWKCICSSLGLFSFLAVVARSFSSVFRSPSLSVWNTFSFIFRWLLSIAHSLGLSGSILLLLPLIPVMFTVCRVVSTCCHLSFAISPILAAVSFSSCRSVAVFGCPAAIRLSSSSSFGMNGSGSSIVYVGLAHVLPVYFRYSV